MSYIDILVLNLDQFQSLLRMNHSIQCNHIEPHKDLFIYVNYASTNETGPTFKCCQVFILCITLATNLLVSSASFFIVLEKIISKITLFTDSGWPKRFLKKNHTKIRTFSEQFRRIRTLKKIRTNRTFKKNVTIKKHIKIQLFMCEGLNFFSRRSHFIAICTLTHIYTVNQDDNKRRNK